MNTGKLAMKVHRAKMNLTQKQVADALEVDRNTYANWEKYNSYPNALQLIKLAEIFQCSMDDIFFEIPLAAS